MKTILLVTLLPLSAMARPFTLTSPKAGSWSGIPEHYRENLDNEAEKTCTMKLGTKAKRLADFNYVYSGSYVYLTGTYECDSGPFVVTFRCGPFGGCDGTEIAELQRMANERCKAEDYSGATRTSDYSEERLGVSATYYCRGGE